MTDKQESLRAYSDFSSSQCTSGHSFRLFWAQLRFAAHTRIIMFYVVSLHSPIIQKDLGGGRRREGNNFYGTPIKLPDLLYYHCGVKGKKTKLLFGKTKQPVTFLDSVGIHGMMDDESSHLDPCVKFQHAT